MSESPHSPEPSPEITDGSQLRIPNTPLEHSNQAEEGFKMESHDERSGEEKSTNAGSTDALTARVSSSASLPDQARAGLALIKEMRAKGLLRDNR